jgi:heme A synthase
VRVSLRAYTLFMTLATFFLVIAGGMVTSTGSALAVPDWPLSFGQVFPKMEGGVFYEHGHRMVAVTVGMLTIILAVWLWRKAEEPLLKKAGWVALALVCAQGILGGVTVLLKLPAVTSVGHACLGQIFFSWISCIAAMTWSSGAKAEQTPEVRKLRRLALMTTGFVFFQLLFGAIYRHTGLLLHAHFLGATLVFIHAVLLWRRAGKTSMDAWLVRPSQWLFAFVIGQIALGIYTWQRPSVFDATAHVAVGALILAISSVMSLESFRRLAA